MARQGKKIIHEGILDLNGLEMPCYVLMDGTRVLSGRGMQHALRLTDSSSVSDTAKLSGVELTRFLGGKWFNELITNDVKLEQFKPIACYKGNQKINGYEATSLADLCDLILDARNKGLLKTNRQNLIASQCEILIRSFAKVGIIALVDEATGYQYERERSELQKILRAYINEELLPWQKRFPDEFYKEIFRLNKWGHFMSGNIDIKNRPGVIGTWTKRFIYNQLPKGVLEYLTKNVPRDKKGRAKHKFHQLLTDDIGQPHLQNQLTAVLTIMKLSKDWKDFERQFNEIYGQKSIQFEEVEPKQENLSKFNKNLKTALNYNPKEN